MKPTQDTGEPFKWQDSPQNHAMLNEGDVMSASAAGSRRRDVCNWLGCAMLGEKFDLRLLQSAKTEIERLRLTAEEREAIEFVVAEGRVACEYEANILRGLLKRLALRN